MYQFANFSELWNSAVNNSLEEISSKIYPTRSLIEQLGVMKGSLTGFERNDPESVKASGEAVKDIVGKLIPMVRAIKKAAEDEIADIRLDIELGYPSSQVWPRMIALGKRFAAINDSALGNSALLGEDAFNMELPGDFIEYMDSREWNSEEIK